MLYYGDRARRVDPRQLLRAVGGRVVRMRGSAPGIGRHSEAVALLVEAAELAQGVADQAFERSGRDGPDAATDAAMELVLAAAHEVVASWRAALAPGERDLCAVTDALARVREAPLPAAVAVRSAEGFAQYAVYPEAYAEAAATLAEGARVIGIRTSGGGLAAIVAAAAGAARVFTVRPIGHPHAREVSLAPDRLDSLAATGAPVAIVDEGPGLSGSSFAAVVAAAEAAGVAPRRLRLFPSHPGPPGPAAAPAWRERWDSLARTPADVDRVLLGRRGVASWIAELTAAPATLDELSAGAWRARVLADRGRWPAVFRQQERRKFLAVAGERRWLAEFVGLGPSGERRLARARALGAAGLAPATLGLAHGFLVRDWLEAPTLGAGAGGDLLDQVARYLAFRARYFLAGADDGARPEELLAMARLNALEALGAAHAAELERFAEGSRLAAATARPIAVDGKLEREEWLVTGDGRLVKTDALTHADAHDLVGCQDAGWDVAAAAFELDLPRDELAGRVAALARLELAGAALAFYEVAYLAARVARWHFALCAEDEPEERARIEAALARYRAALAARLERARA